MSDKINNLINDLSRKQPVSRLYSVKSAFTKWVFYTVLYIILAPFFLGVRADILNKLVEFNYAIELTGLAFIMLTSLFSAINLAVPDYQQNRAVVYMPPVFIIVFLSVLAYLVVNHHSAGSIDHVQGILCVRCITLTSLIPSAFLFMEVKKAATTRPNLLSFYIIMYAVSLSALCLRLEESEASVYHTILYHYLPVIVFSATVYFIPKKFLSW